MAMHHHPHPGRLVKRALITGAGLSVTDAAKRLDVDRTTFSRLINEHTGISPEMALRLSMLLNTSPDMWLNLQKNYELSQLEKVRPSIHIQPLGGQTTQS
jgi:addiction module HigA family antidote